MNKPISGTKVRHSQLKALCALSDTSTALNPDNLATLIREAPDPETATRAVFQQLTTCSEVLQRKWRKLVVDMWSTHHPHLPVLLNLPITASDVADVAAVQDALTFLRLVHDRPPTLVQESDEWLVDPDDAHHLASNLPSLRRQTLVQFENEWQCLPLRHLRALLQSLRLVRRVKNRLVIVESRYQHFSKFPAVQQFYLLWHAEAYHVDWSQFAGIWSDYLRVVQEYLPLLWGVSEGTVPDMPYDIRQWNQDVWDTYFNLWEQEGLFERQNSNSALLSLVRVHSLPTAITQVIMKDFLERYGLVCGEGEFYAWTNLGIELIGAERTQELPCALDLLK